ncbi:MAG: ion transporter [Gammaproteobacteria bacterium]|nr:ion transporter [Gammaproteobacteria bacterium]
MSTEHRPGPYPESYVSAENLGFGQPADGWRRRLYIIIFESHTPAGLAFDVCLLLAIVASVLVVMLDSVDSIHNAYGQRLHYVEWVFTAFFSFEYLARLSCVQRPGRYARSFFGVVDLLSVLPTYLAFFFPGLHSLVDIRMLRMLRIFRVLKLTAYLVEYRQLAQALRASRRKVMVFLSAVAIVVVLLGTVMYVIEGPGNGFSSIPVSVYWAITTMTTVGFGDITPHTDAGRAIASVMMLLGWGTLAVPTGIVTAEITTRRGDGTDVRCHACAATGHPRGARFCYECGVPLQADQ